MGTAGLPCDGFEGRREMTHAPVTGGAGCIGANLVARLLDEGRRVVLYDDLLRTHSASNVAWLRTESGLVDGS